MASCKINELQKGFLETYYKLSGEEGLRDACEKYNISFEDALEVIETGSGIKRSPSIKNPVQISKIDGYVSEIVDNTTTILGYYSDYPDEAEGVKKDFVKDIVNASLINMSTLEFMKPTSIIPGMGSYLGVSIHALKIKYANSLLRMVSLGDDTMNMIINHKDDMETKQEKYDSILSYTWDRIGAFKPVDGSGESEYLNILNTYVKLKYFDSFINSVPFVNINEIYNNVFDYNRYYYTSGKVDHYKGLSSEIATSDDNISDMSKLILDFLPEMRVDEDGNLFPINRTAVTLKGFQAISNRFKSWLRKNMINDEYIQTELKKGVVADWNNLMNMWMANDKISSLDRLKANTIKNFIFGKKNGKFITPDDIRMDLAHIIEDEESPIWLEHVQDSEDIELFVPRTLSERRFLSKKSEMIESFVGAVINWRYNKEMYDTIANREYTSFEELAKIVEDLTFQKIPDSFIDDNSIINERLNPYTLLESIRNIIINAVEVDEGSDVETESDLIDFVKNKIKENDAIILNYSKVFTVSNRESYNSVIKNSEGNNLPLRQLVSLATSKDKFWLNQEAKEYSDGNYNLISNNIQNVLTPVIKNTTVSNIGATSHNKLTYKEYITEAIVSDFLYNLYNQQIDSNGSPYTSIILQPNCFSDKISNYGYPYVISNLWKFKLDGERKNEHNFEDLLKRVISGDVVSESYLLEIWRQSWSRELLKYKNNILDDYRKIFGDYSDDELISMAEKAMRNPFEFIKKAYSVGVILVENIHYNKGCKFNVILNGLIDITSNKEKFKKYYYRLLNDLVDDLDANEGKLRAWSYIGQSSVVKKHLSYFGKKHGVLGLYKKPISVENEYGEFIDTYDETDEVNIKNESGEINPLLKSFVLAHNIFAESTNRFMFGNYYSHDDKSRSDDIYDHISSAWKAQTKRLAIVGATYHSYSQGLEMGVPRNMNIACIDDEKSYVVNANGETDYIDSKDGSGDVSPYFSRMANKSLGPAGVNGNKKTIWHFYDEKYGSAGMLKWAEYEITNFRRRSSWNSPTREELKFKKMHSIPFNYEQKQKIAQLAGLIYSSKNKITYINGSVEYVTIDDIGFVLDGENLIAHVNTDKGSYDTVINNIYDLDQILGGSWAVDVNTQTSRYVYTERNQDIIYEIICKCGLKNSMIHYAVNTSGMKTGRKAINSSDVLKNDEEMMYFSELTLYGGVQMDADHNLEESQSTEPSQLVAHIGQDGTSQYSINKIYELLSSNILNSIQDYVKALNEGDVKSIKSIISESIISAFNTGERSTISLAQAFISNASKNGDYNLPFSSESINSIFVSTLMSEFSKKAARRKYTGVGGVLNPSYDSMMYYNIDGNNYTYGNLVFKLKTFVTLFNKEHSLNVSIDDYITNPYINGIRNPHMNEPVYKINNEGVTIEVNPIQLGDTYIIHYPESSEGSGLYIDLNGVETSSRYEEIKINDILDLLNFKHKFIPNSENNFRGYEITRNQLAPRNLRGFDVSYKVEVDDKIYSFSHLENPYSLALLALKNDIYQILLEDGNNEISNILKHRAKEIIDFAKKKTDNTEKAINYIRNRQKEYFNNLDLYGDFFGIGTVIEIDSRPAEIIMGKIYAKQLGLLPGDSISDVTSSNFFERRLWDTYSTIENPDKLSYDAILFDGSGNKIYVKIGNERDLVKSYRFRKNSDYIVSNGKIYHNNKDITSSDGKNYYTLTNSDGVTREYVIVDSYDRLRELSNSQVYSYTYRNINELNSILFGFDESDSIKYLRSQERKLLQGRIKAESKMKYSSFLKSLNFVGTRIPCQSMQSFTPMKIVAFSDSENNEIYIPTYEQWIEGSDYDIDKQYIIGYTLLENGRLLTKHSENAPSYIKDIVIKNNIIDEFLDVITSHKNVINLTSIVSVGDLKKLANKREASTKPMDSANVTSIYKMQDENRVGKSSIGVVAVGGKAFSGASYFINNISNEIYKSLIIEDYETATKLLRQIAWISNDEVMLIPNTNWNWIKRFLNENTDKLKNHQDVVSILTSIRNHFLHQDDNYLVIGQLLNASADNAKELILKKINAYDGWADIYIAGIIAGYSLNDIYNIMTNKEIEDIVLQTDTFALTSLKSENINKLTASITNKDLINKFNKIYKISQELQVIGAMCGVNQGFPTKKYEILKFINRIERSANSLAGKDFDFDVFKFFLNEEYAKKYIDEYNDIKEIFNPFEVIYNHPLFKTQWLAFLTGVSLLNISVRNKLEYSLLKKKYHNTIKEYNNDVNRISKQLDTLWLKDVDLIFNIPVSHKSILPKSMNITTDYEWKSKDEKGKETIAVFKKYMERYAIPKLKSLYPENLFIQSLRYDTKQKYDFFGDYYITGTKEIYFKVPINMMDIDADEYTRQQYRDLSRAFNSLRNIRFEGNNIINLLYIYNVIVNTSFSRSSMARFFSDMVSSGYDNIIVDHNNWLDNQNFNDLKKEISLDKKQIFAKAYDIDDYKYKVDKYYKLSPSNIEKVQDIPEISSKYIVYYNNETINKLEEYGLDTQEASRIGSYARAFIYNGLIFINTDLADRNDLRHEMAHFVIGLLKSKSKSGEYIKEKMMSFFYSKPELGYLIDRFSNDPVYKFLKGSDLIEEAIVHYIEKSEDNFNEFLHNIELEEFDTLINLADSILTENNVNTVKLVQQTSELRNTLITKGENLKKENKIQKMSVLEKC